MKAEHINGAFKMKNNFDYKEEVVQSPKHQLKHQPLLRATAERTLDSEIRISAIIPFDGSLKISFSVGKKSSELFSKKTNKGFLITTIPVSVHDEISELKFQLKGKSKNEKLKVQVLREEIQN